MNPSQPDSPAEVFAEKLARARVVGIVWAASPELALTGVRAAVAGGLQAVEVTFSTPDAGAVIQALSRTLPEGVLLGAGTVLNAAQAETAIMNGAGFLVSPHLGEDVLDVAQDAGVPYLPGVLTPTEIVWAKVLGVDMVKLFPVGSAGGVRYLKDLFGPLLK